MLFRNATNGGRCGMAQSAMGPFYCPPDKQIFLDTRFFREVETRFRGCSGNACKFTAAYIIAHEAGHHIQNLLGILPRVTRLQQQAGSKAEANALQVKVELQADCLSGVWVNREEKKRPGFLEAGDIDAALTTATAIGDDTLQRQATGPGGAGFLHPRLGRAAQAMVHDRLSAGHGAGLQHVRRGSVVARSGCSAAVMARADPAIDGARRSACERVDAARVRDTRMKSCPPSTNQNIHPAQHRGADDFRHALAGG